MKLSVAVVGATGAVGAELLRLLEERDFPVGEVRAFASERSSGRTVSFAGGELPVHALGEEAFAGVDLAFFCAGAERSRRWAPAAAARGAAVVDNSSAFRMEPGVPLVVPEINPRALDEPAWIVANPNCTTIVALMALGPIHRAVGLESVRAASYQAVSGAGARGMRELAEQTEALSRGEEAVPEVFAHPIASNVIPQVGGFLPGGETEEERKLRDESRKILDHPDLRVSAVCVRVPVMRAHCVALWVETREALSPDRAREILREADGVMVLDDPGSLSYPMPLLAAGREAVQVGRLRADGEGGNGLTMFVAGDQLLKGAALNALQIAELLIRKGHLRWPR